MRKPSVSVIIPAYNAADFILDAVESVEQQEYENIDVVVVDNMSTDRTVEILSERGIHWIREQVQGAGAARKAGIRARSSEFIFFLDADDVLLPGAIAALVDAAKRNEFHGSFGMIENEVLSNSNSDSGRTFLNIGKKMLSPAASSTIFKREVFTLFDEMSDDNFSWPKWIVRSRKCGINLNTVDQVVAKRRIHSANFSINGEGYRNFFKLIRENSNPNVQAEDL